MWRKKKKRMKLSGNPKIKIAEKKLDRMPHTLKCIQLLADKPVLFLFTFVNSWKAVKSDEPAFNTASNRSEQNRAVRISQENEPKSFHSGPQTESRFRERTLHGSPPLLTSPRECLSFEPAFSRLHHNQEVPEKKLVHTCCNNSKTMYLLLLLTNRTFTA